MKSKHIPFPLLISIAFVSVQGAHAASGTWTQTTAGPFNWGDSANWSGSIIADGSDNTAAFLPDITADQTINLEAARTIGNIMTTDASHNYTISGGNTLTLESSTPAIPVLSVAPQPRALTISSVIAGNDGLAKIGAGQLNLNGAAVNTFTGGITVTSGILNLDFANLSTPDLVNSGNALTLNGGKLLITSNTVDDAVQTLGNVTVNTAGHILVKPGAFDRTVTLNLGSITLATSHSTLLTGQENSPTPGLHTITTTSGTLTHGIYGGGSVFFDPTDLTGDDYDWATTESVGSPYTLSGLTSYTALPTSGGDATVNYEWAPTVASEVFTLTGDVSVNTLKLPTAELNTTKINLAGFTLTVEGGGILTTGNGKGGDIYGGDLTAGAGSDYKLIVNTYNRRFDKGVTNQPGISGKIVDNGMNPVSLVVSGAPKGTTDATSQATGMMYLSNPANSFTGGVYLNNGALHLQTGTPAALNNNTIYVSGHSVLYVCVGTTGSSIQLDEGAVLDFRNNNNTLTTSGAVTGKGGINIAQGGAGFTTVNLNSTSNDFSGPIEYRISSAGTLSLNSIGDAEVLGSGDIRFGAEYTSNNLQIFNFGGTAGAPAAPLIFNKRRFELDGNNRRSEINNNSAENFTINTDMLTTGNFSLLLTLGGTGAGNNTYAGKIGDNPTVTTGSTVLTTAAPIGSTTLTLASVAGISIGATITGSSRIPAGTTVTAINPVTKQVTLSAATTGGSINQWQILTVDGVTSALSITKSGATVWTLSGDNTYSGGTTVTAGTLTAALTGSLGTGNVTITAGNLQIDALNAASTSATLTAPDTAGVLILNADQTVAAATIGGSPLADGDYSAALGDTFITGTGVLHVVAPPSGSAYDTWAAINAPGSDPDEDFDGDGVSNAVEFVLGGDKDTNDLGKLPVIDTDGTDMTFTFERDQDSIDPEVSVVIEVSTDLITWDTAPSPYAVPDTATAGPPVAVVDNLDGTDTITLTVAQAPDAKKFARLKVVITP